MAARITNAEIARMFATLNARLDALEQPVAKGAPASARAASKLPSEIHDPKACNRRFTPASSGRTSHVARLED